MFFDPLYFLILAPALALSLWATWTTKRRFAHYGAIAIQSGQSGARVARQILDRNGLGAVAVEEHGGFLSDHYDPRARVVRLSPDVFHGRSISAVAVAAHETGHAIQHGKRYFPLALRNLAVPVASIGSNFAWILIMAGMFLSWTGLALLGVLLFSATVAFQLITLPVEFDASRRAKQILVAERMVAPSEQEGVSKVLGAAAMTYVAGALTAVLTLLYFLLRLGVLGGRDD